MEESDLKLLFLIGTGRCGSSFVHEVITGHEDVGFISNIDDNFSHLNLMGRYNNSLYRLASGRFTTKGRLRFAPSEAYKLIGDNVSPIYVAPSRDLIRSDVTPWLTGQFETFFSDRSQSQNKSLFSHKYTGWPRIGFFHEMFPQARFIHVVRDGRAVANSWLQMPWWGGYSGPENWPWGTLPGNLQIEWEKGDRSYVLLAAICWKMLMESYEIAAASLPADQLLTIRYEDFIEEPREVISQCLSFGGLRWTNRYERFFNKQKVKQSRAQSFRGELGEQQLCVVQNSIQKILTRYHYD